MNATFSSTYLARAETCHHVLNLSVRLLKDTMEPLSALSLFCNVIDLCKHTIQVYEGCREICKSAKGLRAQDEELLKYLGDLQEILNSMRSSSSKLNRDDSCRSVAGPSQPDGSQGMRCQRHGGWIWSAETGQASLHFHGCVQNHPRPRPVGSSLAGVEAMSN